MGSNATLVYSVPAVGQTPAVLAALIGAVPVPADILAALGLYVTADATPALNPVIRTIVLSFIPTAPAAATPVLTNEGRIRAIAIGGDGLDYIAPPQVTIAQVGRPPTAPNAILRSFLRCPQVAIVLPGANYTAPTVTFLGGLPPADRTFVGCVRYLNIKNGGRGYAPGSTVSIEGGGATIQAICAPVFDAQGTLVSAAILDMGAGYTYYPQVVVTPPPGSPPPTRAAEAFAIMAQGRPARGTVNLVGAPPSAIASVTVTDRGEGYVGVPDVVFADPTGVGAGAQGRAQMGVGRVDVINEGQDYDATATVVFTPWFKTLFPDAFGNPAQAAPFFRLMQTALERAGLTPVTSAPPVIA